ncbi:MAG: TIM barrel protein [Methylococcales bacterium]|jgi:hydroxypyruvate isomerase|nr:TIM barrel protein [Methylococcales bacterium]
MPHFAANLSLLFTELKFTERFNAAKQHGFDAIEIQFPYQETADTLLNLLHENELQLILFNVDADDLLNGGEGLACVPSKQAQFQEAVEKAQHYAKILTPEFINVLPGRALNPEHHDRYLKQFNENLHFALTQFSAIGVKTVFEAINTYDLPGFIVSRTQHMLNILAQIKHPNLMLQLDIYHMHRMGDDVCHFIKKHTPLIGHIQFADHPGRHQPGTGLIDFVELFDTLDHSTYPGWVGAEYLPQGPTTSSLEWLTKFAHRS